MNQITTIGQKREMIVRNPQSIAVRAVEPENKGPSQTNISDIRKWNDFMRTMNRTYVDYTSRNCLTDRYINEWQRRCSAVGIIEQWLGQDSKTIYGKQATSEQVYLWSNFGRELKEFEITSSMPDEKNSVDLRPNDLILWIKSNKEKFGLYDATDIALLQDEAKEKHRVHLVLCGYFSFLAGAGAAFYASWSLFNHVFIPKMNEEFAKQTQQFLKHIEKN